MRIFATSIILIAMTASAHASSIVMLGSQTKVSGPSVIVLGSQPARSSIVVLGSSESSPSLVAFGEPVRSVDPEEVAAIPAEPKTTPRRPGQLPMVIRGGLAGDAFARAETTPPTPQQEEPAAADPEQAQAPDGAIRLAPPGEPTSEPPVVAEEVPDGPALR